MDKTKVVTVRLDPRRLAFVDAEAAARRWSRSTVIQALIDSASGATDRPPEPPTPATSGDPVDHRPPPGPAQGASCAFKPSPRNELRCALCGRTLGAHR